MNAKKNKYRILLWCIISFILISCSQIKFKTQKQTLNETFKSILAIKEIVPFKIIVVKILPNKISSDVWNIGSGISAQSKISAALEYGLMTVGEKYNIREAIPILYRGANGSYTGGFILMVEPKWSSPSEREISIN